MRKEVNGGQSYWVLFWICFSAQLYIFCLSHIYYSTKGFPTVQHVKKPSVMCETQDGVGLIPGLRRFLRGKWQPTSVYLLLGNPMDRAWPAIVPGVTKSRTWPSMSTMLPCHTAFFPPLLIKITLWKALMTLELFNKPCLHLLLTFHLYKMHNSESGVFLGSLLKMSKFKPFYSSSSEEENEWIVSSGRGSLRKNIQNRYTMNRTQPSSSDLASLIYMSVKATVKQWVLHRN